MLHRGRGRTTAYPRTMGWSSGQRSQGPRRRGSPQSRGSRSRRRDRMAAAVSTHEAPNAATALVFLFSEGLRSRESSVICARERSSCGTLISEGTCSPVSSAASFAPLVYAPSVPGHRSAYSSASAGHVLRIAADLVGRFAARAPKQLVGQLFIGGLLRACVGRRQLSRKVA